MLRLVTAHPSHFDLLELRSHEADSMALDPLSGANATQLVESSVCSTMLYKGRILCILGFYQLWPGVYNVWIFPSVYAAKHSLVFLRAAKRYTQSLLRDLPCHRLQSLAVADGLHRSWMTFLGFRYEGCLEKYTPDMVDYEQWAIIKESA